MIKRIHRDSRALEGFPLRLMIVLLLVTISFPIFINAHHKYVSVLCSEAVEVEMEKLESAAISAFLGGPGSRRTVDIQLPSGPDANAVTIGIGGKCGSSQARCMWYRVGDVCGTKVIEDLPIDITSPTGDSMLIETPGAKLILDCIQGESGSWIEARLAS